MSVYNSVRLEYFSKIYQDPGKMEKLVSYKILEITMYVWMSVVSNCYINIEIFILTMRQLCIY